MIEFLMGRWLVDECVGNDGQHFQGLRKIALERCHPIFRNSGMADLDEIAASDKIGIAPTNARMIGDFGGSNVINKS